MKTLSQILNSTPTTALTEGAAWKILNATLRGLGFKVATGSDMRSFKGLPKDDIYTLYGIPMRAGKWADVWFAILEDDYAVVNDEKVTVFDHMGDAIKAIQKIGVQQKKTVTEDALEEAVSKSFIEDLLDAAAKVQRKNKQLRHGQSIMIALKDMNSKLYSDVTGTKYDPFYNDKKIPALLKHLNPNWQFSNLDEAVDFRKMTDTNLKQWLKRNDTDDSVSAVFGAKKEAKCRDIRFNEASEIQEDAELNEEVDYYKFKQLAILGLLSPSDANKAALGMKAIEGGHPPTQEQKRIIGDTLVLLVNMITGDSAVLNKLKKTARDAKNAVAQKV
jgi:hypothetical protein